MNPNSPKNENDPLRTKRAYYRCEQCHEEFYEDNKAPNLNLVHLPCGQIMKLLRFEANLTFEDFTDWQAESVKAEYEDYLFKKKFYKEDEEDEDDEPDLFEL